MKKSELDKYVGKLVIISFQDGDVLGGTLGHGMGLGNNLYNDDKRFFINGACLWILQDKGGIWYVNELLDLLENEVDLKKKLLMFLETGQLTSPTSSDTQSQPVSTTTNQTGN